MTDTHETLMLNGVSIDKGLDELLKMYRAQSANSDTAVPHPVIERQRKIEMNKSSIDDIVKGTLGNSVKADHARAEEIVKKLAYEVAKSDDTFHGELKDFRDEDVRKYLSQAGGALGSQTVSNKTELVKSIMNMASAKPGDPLYDQNSEMGRLIQYIATQKDADSKRISYLQSLIAEKWQMPKYGIALQNGLSTRFGIPFDQTATASEALGEINRRSQIESQQYAANTPKTYISQGGQGASAHGGH